jgi:uncharacterized delta-60 repeat protein
MFRSDFVRLYLPKHIIVALAACFICLPLMSRGQTPGTLDPLFPNGTGADGDVHIVTLQPDNQIIIGGNFSTVNGASRAGIARLNPDGSSDNTFLSAGGGLSFGYVDGIAIQSDGKLVIGGFFDSVNGTNRDNLARLNTNGTLDISFPNTANPMKGTDSSVTAVAVQPVTGKLLVAGSFSQINGSNHLGLARLNLDGSIDAGFTTVLDGSVQTMALQTNGQIIIAGFFTTVNGSGRTNLARLNLNGDPDINFNSQLDGSATIQSLSIQPDGKILIGGTFNAVGSSPRFNIARLTSTGSLDVSFQEGMPGIYHSFFPEVRRIAVQPSGLIVIGGSFEYVNSSPRTNIARLNPDGSTDDSFNAGGGPDDGVHAMVLQPDGKVVVGGSFTSFNGVPRPGLARVYAGTAEVNMCSEIPLPAGRSKSDLVDLNPVSVVPPEGATWDAIDKVLYPGTNGAITVTWHFKTAPTTVVQVVTILPLPANVYDLGQEVPPPSCAAVNLDPDTGNRAFWHRFTHKLYATFPGSATVIWKRANGSTFPQPVIGQWPTNSAFYQIHVARTPAVDLSGSGQYGYSAMLNQDGTAVASVVNNQFVATGTGRSLLLLSPGLSPDVTNIFFQFVKTIVWNDPAYFRDTDTAVIGDPIIDPGHNPSCGSPYVFDYLTSSFPWRYCADANFYNRTNRTGPVIPVNRSASGTRADDLLLINYQLGAKAKDPVNGNLLTNQVCWPYQPVRYLSVWPTTPDTIFIAGGQGSGPVMLPDINWSVYRQRNPNLLGYNPNEEHAFRYSAPPPLVRLKLGASSVMVAEGDAVQVSVALVGDPAYAPQSPVTIAVSPVRDGDTNLFVVFPTNAPSQQLVFAPTNWQTPQSITIAANTNIAAGSNSFVFRASGGLFTQAALDALESDTTKPGLVIDNLSFEITEQASRVVRIRLSKAPASNVTVTTSNRGLPADSLNLRVESGGTLIFNPTNWNVAQIVSIHADADADSGNDVAVFNVQATGGLVTNASITVTQADTTPVREAVYALRNDLGDPFGTVTPQSSESYVLLKYTNTLREGRMKVYKVLAEDANHQFRSNQKAGQLLQPPYPLTTLPKCPTTVAVSGPYFRDRNEDYWAKAAGISNNLPVATNIVLHYFYHPFTTSDANGFDPPPNGAPYTGTECLPWLDKYANTPGVPVNFTFSITWPDSVPELRIGETLVKPKFGLPNIANQCSVDVLYEQTGPGTLVQLFDPLAVRVFPVSNLPGNKLPPQIVTQIDPANQKLVFMDVPLTLRKRLRFNPNSNPPQFEFGGYYNDTDFVGEPLLLPNIMTASEAAMLANLSSDSAYTLAIFNLWAITVNSAAGASSIGSQFKALSAAFANGQGYVSLAMQNSIDCGALPVSVEIIKVTCPLTQGDIKPIYADCAFDETLTLRHSADFAGRGDNYEYEWFYRRFGDLAWIKDSTQTRQDLTIKGPGLKTLEDYEYYCHYRPTGGGLCGTNWSPDTHPVLAEGWIKRVLRGVNPFTQITTDFHSGVVDTTANMIQQAGHRWEGSIALNCLPGNQFGLIEAYETVLRRGIDLSIGAGFPLADDTALRLAAGQLSDLYMLLGNEAYADAQDPTIGFGTEGGQYTATSTHCFEGQVSSLLEEELTLLRGRSGPFGSDNSSGTRVDIAPVYNRLYWNFGPDQAGQTAYVLNYSIVDKNGSGTVNATDAQIMFPQGHGDAWGHYLSAVSSYYRLFSDPNYTWVPEFEAVNINGADVEVNYQHERKFAKAAAARARTGAEIVNLTYRSLYVEDPAGQWLGYRDSDTNRAWGVSEWASRTGQAALFDWLTGNALLPDKDLVDPPLSKVDRTTVSELREIAASGIDIQQAMDTADGGLNPLGLDKNVVPFGLDPGALTTGQTHFDQVYGRAITALNNAIAVFNHANEPTQLLRKQQDTLVEFQRNVTERLSDFTNRLIEIFGYPYPQDIGGAGAYPSGYVGPDIYHYSYVDVQQLAGVPPPTTQVLPVNLQDLVIGQDGTLTTNTHPVAFNFASDTLQLVKPANFTTRLAPGEIQRALGDLTQAKVRFEQALPTYDNLLAQIQDQADLIKAQFNLNAQELQVLNTTAQTQRSLNDQITAWRTAQIALRGTANAIVRIADATAEFLPTSVGFSVDATAPARGGIRLAGAIASQAMDVSADVLSLEELSEQQAKEDAQNTSAIELATLRQVQALLPLTAQLEQLVRQEAVQRYELYNLREAVHQAAGNYLAIVAKGYRLIEDRVRFLQETAAQVQAYRYKDMAFRIFRNDALQKYRAQFDLAARYVYLAAKAYDYETGLLQTSGKSGSAFLEDIVKKRAIGTIQNNVPLPGTIGDSGLAAAMAAMSQDYTTIKANLGLNNQITRQRLFSLRNGWFRIANAATNSTLWQQTLRRQRVDNIWNIPEFQRYCRPLRPQPANGHEPAIVIAFPSMIVAENNFFGWPAGGGDSGYNSSVYSTKILSAGIWFSSYDSTANGLVQFPNAWLVPVGEDVVRAAGANDFSYRHWKVFDQKIPTPLDFLSSPPNYGVNWIPINFSLNGELGAVGGQRQYSAIDATTESQSIPLDTAHIQTDSGLVGRSVWNTQWLLIIPGVGLLGSNPDEGLERFIAGALVGGQRTGNGVTDIKIYFQTYSYSGF